MADKKLKVIDGLTKVCDALEPYTKNERIRILLAASELYDLPLVLDEDRLDEGEPAETPDVE